MYHKTLLKVFTLILETQFGVFTKLLVLTVPTMLTLIFLYVTKPSIFRTEQCGMGTDLSYSLLKPVETHDLLENLCTSYFTLLHILVDPYPHDEFMSNNILLRYT